jgi:hypothetical protein
MWRAVFADAAVAVSFWAVTVVLIVAWFYRLLNEPGSALEPAFAAAVIIGLLISPRVGWYDWTVLSVPAVLLWQSYPRQRRRMVAAGAWLMLASASSWQLGTSLGESTGTFLQIAPMILAIVAWWWYRTIPADESVETQYAPSS